MIQTSNKPHNKSYWVSKKTKGGGRNFSNFTKFPATCFYRATDSSGYFSTTSSSSIVRRERYFNHLLQILLGKDKTLALFSLGHYPLLHHLAVDLGCPRVRQERVDRVCLSGHTQNAREKTSERQRYRKTPTKHVALWHESGQEQTARRHT